jgi:hypothetical protein
MGVAKEAKRLADATDRPEVDRQAKARVAARAECERLGIGPNDGPTSERYSQIASARSITVAKLHSWSDDCTFWHVGFPRRPVDDSLKALSLPS